MTDEDTHDDNYFSETVIAAHAHKRSCSLALAMQLFPVKNGPWKLDGLPGLILEAETNGNQYSFIATGIHQTDKPIASVYLANEYENVTRIEYLKYCRAFMDNPLGKINAQFGDAGETISTSDGDELNDLFVPVSLVDFLETDYH